MNIKFSFSLREFWLGLRVQNSVSSFIDYQTFYLNLIPCLTIAFTRQVGVVRDYGLIVEASQKYDINKIKPVGTIEYQSLANRKERRVEYVDHAGTATHISNLDKEFNS